MQKWEYLSVSNAVGIFVNGKRLDPQPSDFYQYLNQLGSQGWELVGIGVKSPSGPGTYTVETYVFKRPKP